MPERPAGGPTDVLVLGAAGYVGGELLRLVAGHPRLRLAAAFSRSRAGTALETVHPHLGGVFPETVFVDPGSPDAVLRGSGPLAVFGCAPHGESAGALADLLEAVARSGRPPLVVDLSADFRHADPERYRAIYGRPHGAPELLPRFTCALPEHHPGLPAGHVAHPGCFTTAVVLGARPLVARELAPGGLAVAATTGSTGSGRSPSATTHHPLRHGDLRGYQPLRHRHVPEMEALLAASETSVPISFVPQSGPFARGIHAVIQARPPREVGQEELLHIYKEAYAGTPFVRVDAHPPRMKEVVGTNLCRIGVAAHGGGVAVLVVLDNLTKGAAGGALQWMNRLLGIPETEGLGLVPIPWI